MIVRECLCHGTARRKGARPAEEKKEENED